MFEEYPKWVYPAGVKESYEPGEEPSLVQNGDEEAALIRTEEPKKRGRPAKVEAE